MLLLERRFLFLSTDVLQNVLFDSSMLSTRWRYVAVKEWSINFYQHTYLTYCERLYPRLSNTPYEHFNICVNHGVLYSKHTQNSVRVLMWHLQLLYVHQPQITLRILNGQPVSSQKPARKFRLEISLICPDRVGFFQICMMYGAVRNCIELFSYQAKALGAIHSPLVANSSSKRLKVDEILQNDSRVTLFLSARLHF